MLHSKLSRAQLCGRKVIDENGGDRVYDKDNELESGIFVESTESSLRSEYTMRLTHVISCLLSKSP